MNKDNNIKSTVYLIKSNGILEVIKMNCPYCEPKDVNFTSDSALRKLYNIDGYKKFKEYYQLGYCIKCKNEFYFHYDYYQSTETNVYCEYLRKDIYNIVVNKFGVSSEITKYLDKEDLKRAYSDAIKIYTLDVSDECKVGNLRPIIECYLKYEQGGKEIPRLKEALSKINNDNLREALSKIVEECKKGLHIKSEKVIVNPVELLTFINILLESAYKIPAVKRASEEKLKNATNQIQDKFNILNKDKEN